MRLAMRVTSVPLVANEYRHQATGLILHESMLLSSRSELMRFMAPSRSIESSPVTRGPGKGVLPVVGFDAGAR